MEVEEVEELGAHISFPNKETAIAWENETKHKLSIGAEIGGVLMYRSRERFSGKEWVKLQKLAMELSADNKHLRVR